MCASSEIPSAVSLFVVSFSSSACCCHGIRFFSVFRWAVPKRKEKKRNEEKKTNKHKQHTNLHFRISIWRAFTLSWAKLSWADIRYVGWLAGCLAGWLVRDTFAAVIFRFERVILSRGSWMNMRRKWKHTDRMKRKEKKRKETHSQHAIRTLSLSAAKSIIIPYFKYCTPLFLCVLWLWLLLFFLLYHYCFAVVVDAAPFAL